MADLKISALPASTVPLGGTEVLPIVQGSATKQVTVANLTAGRDVSALTLASTTGATFATTSGSVGVGTASPASTLDVSSATGIISRRAAAPDQYVNLMADGTGPSVKFFGGAAGTKIAVISADAQCTALSVVAVGAAPIRLATNNIQRVSVEAAGDVTVNTGNLIQGTAAKGINFTANTPAAGMTSQLLNWYEEGTWTPSIGGTATYTVQEGRYVKVGSFVYLQAKIQINVLGTGSTTTITGAPFTSLTTSFASGGTGSVAYFGSLATAVTTLIPSIGSGSTSIIFGSVAVAATTMTASTAVFGNSTRIDFSMTYRAA